MKIEIDSELLERILNLVNQEYYAEAWEMIQMIHILIEGSIYNLIGKNINFKQLKRAQLESEVKNVNANQMLKV